MKGVNETGNQVKRKREVAGRRGGGRKLRESRDTAIAKVLYVYYSHKKNEKAKRQKKRDTEKEKEQPRILQ